MRTKVIIALVFLSLGCSYAQSASLDDFQGPLIPRHRLLYSLDVSYYHQNEKGTHGSASFGEFNSEPAYFTIANHFRFAPFENTEFQIGYSDSFSPVYQRFTFNEAGSALSFLNDYRADQFHEFEVDVRHRRGSYEFFVDSYGNDQRSSWHSAPGFTEGNFFTHIKSHYEDVIGGLRFADERLSLEAQLRYRNGRLVRMNDFFGTPSATRNYFHELRFHFTSEISFVYGINDNLKLNSGLAYTTPYKYKYEFQQFNSTNTSRFFAATYSMTKQFFLPLGVRYRKNNWSFMVSSDVTAAKQRLDAHEKPFVGSLTTTETKKLQYYNVKPTIGVSYFHDADKEERGDVLSETERPMLQKGQFKTSFQWRKDKSFLNKNAANGAQNVIDPYNVFQNPSLDNFLAGTESAAFLAGNSSSSFSNAPAQNFYELDLGFRYGFLDQFNMEWVAGYHSGSALHQRVYDTTISDRFYQFEPYVSIEMITDWQIKDEYRFSLDLYYVPQYKTFLTTSTDPQGYEVKNEYFNATISFKKLF